MTRLFPLLALTLLAGCGARETAAPEGNEATRVAGDLERQRKLIAGEAENGAAAIERALENQSAIVFEQRGDPFNNSAAAVGAGEGSAAEGQPRR